MKKYMVVVLKPVFRNEEFINSLNQELATKYGATSPDDLFNSWKCLEELTNEYNRTCKDHPVSVKQLISEHSFLSYGQLYLELDGTLSEEEARDAIAVNKWIRDTKGKFIEPQLSRRYRKNVLKKIVDQVLIRIGTDPAIVWA
jgi:hypothetical protein